MSARTAAAWGSMVHRWAATGVVAPEPGYENLAELFEKRRDTWPDRETFWPSTGAAEVACGLDCLSGSVAWAEGLSDTERDAWKAALPESWISGSLDYTAELFGIPWVDDLKTGSLCPDPATHPQFLFYGLVAYRRAASASLGEAAHPPDHLLLSVTHWPRYPIAHGAKRRYVHVTAEELDVFEKRLKNAYLNWKTMRDQVVWNNDYVVGPHCQFCPSRTHCPVV